MSQLKKSKLDQSSNKHHSIKNHSKQGKLNKKSLVSSESDSDVSDTDSVKDLTFDTTTNNVTNNDSDSDTDSITHIDIEFEFRDPTPTDWWSYKALLTPYYIQPMTTTKKQKTSQYTTNSRDMQLDESIFDITAFAELLAAQPEIGTVIHADGMEDQPVGILTAISLTHNKQHHCIQQIIDYILHKCTDTTQYNTLQQCMNNTEYNFGLIVNERMINTPTELIVPLHESFTTDIDWAQRNTTETQFQFTHYIILCKCYYAENTLNSTVNSKKRKQKQNRGQALYHKFEEQYYIEHSLLHYNFDVEIDDHTNNAKEIQSRVIGLIEAKELPKIVKQLETLFGSTAESSTT